MDSRIYKNISSSLLIPIRSRCGKLLMKSKELYTHLVGNLV
jgi:hypothetical protein